MRDLLAGHECSTTQECGWQGIKNGELLRLAAAQFDLFITSDQNLQYQQNLTIAPIAILQLSTNDLRRLQVAASSIQAELEKIRALEFRQIRIP